MIFFVTLRERKTFLRYLHQNIAGLFHKRHILEINLNELSGKNKGVDIICLSETFIQKGHEQMANVSGYFLAASYSRQKTQKRGGVCILIKRGFKCRQVNFNNEYSVDNHFECCAIELISQNMLIICLYRTPTSDLNVFFTKLETLLYRITFKYSKKKIVLAGDLNIDTVRPNIKESRRLIDLIKKSVCVY